MLESPCHTTAFTAGAGEASGLSWGSAAGDPCWGASVRGVEGVNSALGVRVGDPLPVPLVGSVAAPVDVVRFPSTEMHTLQ